MPGPNSAPNGDARLVGSEMFCWTHKEHLDRCKPEQCKVTRYREYLHAHNRLVTGKTHKRH